MELTPISPAPRPSETAAVLSPQPTQEGNGGDSVDSTAGPTASSATSAVADRVAVQATPYDAQLPISLLSQPLLVRAEWGWRRFVADILAHLADGDSLSSTTAVATSTARQQSEQAPPASTVIATPQEGSAGTPTQPTPAPGAADSATGATSAQKSATSAQTSATSAQTSATSARTSATSARTNATSARTNAAVDVADPVLDATLATRTVAVASESDGLVSAQTQQAAHTAAVEQALPPPSALPGGLQAAVTQTLWNVLEQTASGLAEHTGGVVLHRPAGLPDVLPFAQIDQATWEVMGQSHSVLQWLVADRLTSAVRTTADPVFAGGLYFLPQSSAATHDGPQTAVRWRAERRTRLASFGRLSHYLKIDLSVAGKQVIVELFSLHPDISIHVGTNHADLRATLTGNLDTARSAVAHLGWQVDKFTVGDLNAQGEE